MNDDLISRQAVLNMKRLFIDEDGIMAYAVPTGNILRLPSVQSTRPTARWSRQTDTYHDYYECENCGIGVGLDDVRNFCPNCGAEMIESEEEE